MNHQAEIKELQEDAELSIEELRSKYNLGGEGYAVVEQQAEEEEEEEGEGDEEESYSSGEEEEEPSSEYEESGSDEEESDFSDESDGLPIFSSLLCLLVWGVGGH